MARYRRRGRGTPMRVGECRITRRGQKYCRLPQGVRFIGRAGMSGMGFPVVTSDLFLADADYGYDGYGYTRRGRGRAMREGECRTTRRGVRYCKRGGFVRFVRG